MQAQASTSMPYIDHTYGGMNGYSGGLAPLNPPAARGEHIWIQIWQYIPIYPAIIPIYALLSDTLGVLGSDLSGGSPRPPYGPRPSSDQTATLPGLLVGQVRPRLGDFISISIGRKTLVTPTQVNNTRSNAYAAKVLMVRCCLKR